MSRLPNWEPNRIGRNLEREESPVEDPDSQKRDAEEQPTSIDSTQLSAIGVMMGQARKGLGLVREVRIPLGQSGKTTNYRECRNNLALMRKLFSIQPDSDLP